MTRTIPRLRAAAALVSAALATGPAAAHHGHGHEGMSPAKGLLHALTEPDHLLMLGAGAIVCTLAAPWLLRVLARWQRRLRERLQARAAEPLRETQR